MDGPLALRTRESSSTALTDVQATSSRPASTSPAGDPTDGFEAIAEPSSSTAPGQSVHTASSKGEDAEQAHLRVNGSSDTKIGGMDVRADQSASSLDGPLSPEKHMDVDLVPAVNGTGTKASKTKRKAVQTVDSTATPADLKTQRGHLVAQKQRDVDEVVGRHDDAVRELFHLDKFTSLLSYDPIEAKDDNSQVFLDFQKQFDLFTHAVASPTKPGQRGMRTTRNALNARKDLLAGSALSAAAEATAASDRKGKARASDTGTLAASKCKPTREDHGKAKVRARASRDELLEKEPDDAVSDEHPSPPLPKAVQALKGKTRVKSKARTSTSTVDTDTDDASDFAPEAKRPKLSKPKPTAKRKAFVPLLPPNSHKRLRLEVPEAPTPTHPLQMLDEPEFGGLVPFLSSYSALSGNREPKRDLKTRMAREARLLNRIDYLKREGRLNSSNPDRKVAGDSKREEDHADALVDEAVQLAKQFIEGRKSRATNGRRLVRGIIEYSEHLAGAEEREQQEIARNLKVLAKWIAKEVLKKWKMAVNVIRARAEAEEEAEQQRLGKLQLDEILEQSAQMLAAHRQHIVASDEDDDSESVSSTPETIVDTESEEDDEDDVAEEGTAESGLTYVTTVDAITGDIVVPQGEVVTADIPVPPIDAIPGNIPVLPPPLDTFSHQQGAPSAAQQDSQPTELQLEAVASAASAIASPRPSEPIINGMVIQPPAAEGSDEPPAKGVLRLGGTEEDEYASEEDEARDMDDAHFEAEMHEDDGNDEDDSDVEMNDLAAEADLPLEELLAKYQYRLSPSPSKSHSPMLNGDSDTLTPSTEVERSTAESPGDAEFAVRDDENREDEDAEMEAQMEDDGSAASSDAEMHGLEADADVPLEELLGDYRPGEDPTPEPSEAAATAEEDESLEQPVAQSPEVSEAAETDAEASDAESTGSQPVIRVKVPFLLRGTLRPYQKAGLDWLASLYVSGLNGILADEMGLGKTIQTIALLGWLATEKGVWGPHLIVVPTSVMLNWEMEFKKFLPGFKILTYYGNSRERKEKRKGWNTENMFHVCVTSYQICLADQHMFRRKPWHYMILDEAHHIKNFRSQRWQTLLGFNTYRRLLLTGTPLQNNLMELWSLLYFLMPAHLNGQAGPFAHHQDFLEWFSNPMDKAIESGESMDEETRATVQRLHTILRPYLLRRLKADVEKQMPAKYEHVVYCRLSKRQRFLYDDFMSRAKTRETLASGNSMGVINCLMQLRKVCNHPDLFEVRPITTSFVTQPAILGYGPTDLLVRKRLLDQGFEGSADLKTLNLVRTEHENESLLAMQDRQLLDASATLQQLVPAKSTDAELDMEQEDLRSESGWRRHLAARARSDLEARVLRMADINASRCATKPFYGAELAIRVRQLVPQNKLKPNDAARDPRAGSDTPFALPSMVRSYAQRSELMREVVSRYAFATPPVVAKDLGYLAIPGLSPEDLILATETFIDEDAYLSMFEEDELGPSDPLQLATTKLAIAFPDRSLLQYDCGKLQKLHELLQQLVSGGHRALIFTQMTKVLDILETFLSFHGWLYLRLDGSTKVEDRQKLTERFNRDPRILCFISSTRAGGLGINLTGADTVVFYDSDWNPSMDRQCQDRCHRIGQTRDVHIYRFISESTIEENVLKKANQKRLLDNMVIAEGEFTTEFFNRFDWRDMLGEQLGEQIGVRSKGTVEGPTDVGTPAIGDESEMRDAFAAAEDEEDQAAAEAAEEEILVDAPDFSEQTVTANQPDADEGGPVLDEELPPAARVDDKKKSKPVKEDEEDEVDEANMINEDDDLEGTIDGYLLRVCDREWEWFDEEF